MSAKKFIIGTSGILLAGVVCYLFWGSSARENIGLETAKVKKGELSNVVTTTGTVEPITQVEVGTQVSGIISRIYVDYNSEVKKGQLIAELDKTVLESELRSKEADLESSKVEFEYQQKNYNRIQLLYAKKLVSDTEFESAEYQYNKSKSAYEKNIADLVKVKTNLSYAIINSPIDGVVLSKAVEEGQTVAASFSTPTLFTIANDLTKMRVIADVDEADIGQVEEGQRVSFTVDAYPNDVFEGEVTQVRMEATTTSNVVTYEVVVNAPNPDLKLKPGLTANITIYTIEKKGILLVPSKALRYEPAKELLGEQTDIVAMEKDSPAKKQLWVKEGHILKEKQVIVGITNGNMTEITEGVTEGEEVVVEMAAGLIMTDANEETEGSSPFMPKPPKRNK